MTNTVFCIGLTRAISMLILVALAGAVSAETPEVIDTQRGERVLNKCLVCHTVDADGQHAAGPNLFGLIGRPVGKSSGYKFSRAMRKSEQTWTLTLLDKFLTAPAEVFPRNRMAFAGLKNPADRAALIAVLAGLKK